MINKFTDSENQILRYWSDAIEIISKVNTADGCSKQEEEKAGYLLADILRLIQAHEITWTVRKIMVDQMLLELADNLLFSDTMLVTAEKICLTLAEKEYFATRLAEMDDRFFCHEAVKIYREIGDYESAIRIKKANLETDYNYVELSQLYENVGDQAAALQTCLDGLAQHKGPKNLIYKYLLNYYEERHDNLAIWELFETAVKSQEDLFEVVSWMFDYCHRLDDRNGLNQVIVSLLEKKDTDIKHWFEQSQDENGYIDWDKGEFLIENYVIETPNKQ